MDRSSAVKSPGAGTVPQGVSARDRPRLVAAMAASAKEQSEHLPVVADVPCRLAAICDDIRIADRPDMARLSTVPIWPAPSGPASGSPDDGSTSPPSSTPRRPSPACPTTRPRRHRGAGGLRPRPLRRPIGWVDARGDVEWAVRPPQHHLDGTRARLVAGSDPDAEWDRPSKKASGHEIGPHRGLTSSGLGANSQVGGRE